MKLHDIILIIENVKRITNKFAYHLKSYFDMSLTSQGQSKLIINVANM